MCVKGWKQLKTGGEWMHFHIKKGDAILYWFFFFAGSQKSLKWLLITSFHEEKISSSILWKQILKILHFSKWQACLFPLWQILTNSKVATLHYVNVQLPSFGNKCRQWIGNMIWAGKVINVLDLQHLKTNPCEVSGPKVQPSMQTSYQL